MNCGHTWSVLAGSMAGRLSFNASLKDYTSFGIGGPARILARPDTVEELAELMAISRREGLNYFIIGAGSNILFQEAGFDGLVIKLGPGFQSWERVGETKIQARAALSGAALMKAAVDLGLAGLECLASIPCTLGGALFMNAGSFGRELGQVVRRIDYLDPAGRTSHLAKEDLRYAYRRLEGLPPGAVILGALLELEPEAPESIKARIDEALKQRSARQPKGLRSAGSVFKNPPGQAAGRLIDEAGLKGRRLGGAQVSEVHANFIVNTGGATYHDVAGLMEMIVEEVRRRHGLTLEPELKLVGPGSGKEGI